MTDDHGTMDDGAGWDRAVAERVRGELRRMPRVDAAAIDRVMAGVMAGALASPTLAVADGGARSRRMPARGALAWLTRPRMVALTPAHAIAAALVLAVAIGGALRRRPAAEPRAVASVVDSVPATRLAADGPRHVVQFVFVSADARDVAIVGDFNDWQAGATPLRRASANGVWTVEVGLEPGRYTYAFVVDGTRWVPDERAPRARDDEFGGEKSVIYVEKQT